MTPQFALAVDPVITHVLRLLDSIGEGAEHSAIDERVRLRALIADADARLGSNPDWELARYGLVAWIDEMLVDAPWKGKEWWSNNVLEVEIFNTRNCYEMFYVRAKGASSLAQRDALEVYYVCVILGFRGFYDDPDLARPIIQNHGLPDDLGTWAHQIALGIRLGVGRPALHANPQPVGGAPPRIWRDRLVWPWLFAVITVSAAVLFYSF